MGEDHQDSQVASALSGVVAASGLGLIAQASISAGISATAEFTNQTIDIAQQGGGNYDIGRIAIESGLGFATSAVGTMLGQFADAKIFKNSVKYFWITMTSG